MCFDYMGNTKLHQKDNRATLEVPKTTLHSRFKAARPTEEHDPKDMNSRTVTTKCLMALHPLFEPSVIKFPSYSVIPLGAFKLLRKWRLDTPHLLLPGLFFPGTLQLRQYRTFTWKVNLAISIVYSQLSYSYQLKNICEKYLRTKYLRTKRMSICP